MPVGVPPLEPNYLEPEVLCWWQKPLRCDFQPVVVSVCHVLVAFAEHGEL